MWKPHYNFSHRAFGLVVNDWTFASIIRLQSGVPFNITTGSDNNGDGVTNDRPNLVPGVAHASLTDDGHSRAGDDSQLGERVAVLRVQYSDQQHPRMPAGWRGSRRVGWNAATERARRSRAARDIDASIFRDFPIWERVRFELRGEATNVFNLTNLPAPNGTLNSSTFGQITSSIQFGSFTNRIIQVGGRILF